MQIKDVKPTSPTGTFGQAGLADAADVRKKATITPYLSSTFSQSPTSVTFSDGQSINLPTLSGSELDQVKKLFGHMSEDQANAILEGGAAIAAAYYASAPNPTGAATQSTAGSLSGSPTTGGVTSSIGQASSSGLTSGIATSTAMPLPSAQANASAVASGAAPSISMAQPTGQSSGSGSGSGNDPNGQAGQPQYRVLGAATGSPPSSTATPGQIAGGTIGATALVAPPAVTQAIGSTLNTAGGGVPPGGNYDQTVQAVTFSGVIGLQNQLADYAKYVQNNINQSNAIQAQAEDLNATLLKWPTQADGKTPQPTVAFQITHQNSDGTYSTTTEKLTQAQAKVAYSDLHGVLSTMQSQTQTDQLQLQNMTQNYSMGITLISNLIKLQGSTTQSIIGNIRSS